MNSKPRILSVLAFSFLFAYLLSFVFEGQVLYRLADYFKISATSSMFAAIFAHFIGLFCCGFFVKTMKRAQKTMLHGIEISFVCTIPFFFQTSFWWTVSLLGCAFFSGCAVAAWGYFLKSCTPKNERIRTCADVLIYSNILMTVINLTSIHLSPFIGLFLSMLALLLARYFTGLLTIIEDHEMEGGRAKDSHSLKEPMLYLSLFVIILTINSGFMYQVFNPAFEHLTWLTSWYWAVPYIVALIIMRKQPFETNRAHFLYIGMIMIMASFIAFTFLDRSAVSYFVIDTLMLSACGIFDLFWWSIIGELLELSDYPAKVFGIGLSANVLGVLFGDILGFIIYSSKLPSTNVTLIALVVICVTLIILPTLNRRLVVILKNHAYLTSYYTVEEKQSKQSIDNLIILNPLTKREHEVLDMILKGKTNKHIATELFISENTVKTHVKNILSKYQVSSRAELISSFLQNHL